ncbi:MAG: SDR family NAD(P)-dependent oxidoreductase [Ignavibacteriaceae bacterium]
MKNIVVTGGAGFLGSHVVKLLLENGNRVVVLDDFSNGKMAHLEAVKDNKDLTIVFGDITIKEDVKKAFDGADAVIHLAVLDLRQSLKDPHRVNEVIVDGTLNCLDTALENNVDLFLNCSSSEAYGTAAYVPMDENHPLRPETPYAAAKVAQDMYVHSYGRSFGLKWTTIRPFNMYGPNSHWQGFRGELIPKMIVRAMNKKPLVVFGEGDQTRDFIYVEDAARAVLKVLENTECRNNIINFSSGKETQIIKIAETICENFGLDKETYIEKQKPRPGDVKRHLGDNTKFKNLLGFKPEINIEEGLRNTIEWFKSLPYAPEELLNQEILRNWE